MRPSALLQYSGLLHATAGTNPALRCTSDGRSTVVAYSSLSYTLNVGAGCGCSSSALAQNATALPSGDQANGVGAPKASRGRSSSLCTLRSRRSSIQSSARSQGGAESVRTLRANTISRPSGDTVGA